MDRRTDRGYLRTEQYATSSNLSARIAIHERFSTATQGWHEWIFDTMALAVRARVLEVGAGTASLWVRNAARVPPIDLVLTDLSAGMIADARLAVGAAARPQWLVAAVQGLPFRAASFDGGARHTAPS